jgi:Ser/Thr protein kinase RdoA (MazF antagonist)
MASDLLGEPPRRTGTPLACADSVILPEALLEVVLAAYGLEQPAACELYAKGLDATYRIEASGGCFMARLYHSRWWSCGEMEYELSALSHLAARGVAVARVVRRPRGELLATVAAAEGPRQLALFEFVDGEPIDPARDAHDYGVTVGELHAASADFVCDVSRRTLELDALVRGSFEPLLRALDPMGPAGLYLKDLYRRVEAWIGREAPFGADRGFCHGDLNFSNAVRAASGRVTLFDFECCAPGLRAYDLAVFRWTQKLVGAAESVWPAFLEGYRERRMIDAGDLAAIDLLVLLRQVWLLNHDAERTNVFSNGTRWRRTGAMRNLSFLERLDRELFSGR